MVTLIVASRVYTDREDTTQSEHVETDSITSLVSVGNGQGVTPSATRENEFKENADQYSLLPEGRIAVDVMELATPPRAAELLARLKNAYNQNPEWFLEHVQVNSVPGQPLPYDNRMGLTESEYKEFQSLSGQMVYRKAGQAYLTVTKTEHGSLLLDGGATLHDLTGIEVDFTNNRISTRYGVLDARSTVDAPSTTALGAWRGYQWEKQVAGQQHGLATDFALGRLSSSGRGVLLYDVKKVDSDGHRTRVDIVLTFDLTSESLAKDRHSAMVR